MTNVLFVCTGNTCRSPMAEALLKEKGIEGVKVKSAGVFAMDGSVASEGAQKALSEQGIHVNHLSSVLTKELIDWSTYIFTMTTGHKLAIAERFPAAIEKTFTLKEFVLQTNEDVVDPFGGSIEIYKETLLELQGLVDELAKKLGG